MQGRSFLPLLVGDAPDAHRDAIFAEMTNLVGDPAHEAILEELRERLDGHVRETDDPLLDASFGRDHDPRAYEPG